MLIYGVITFTVYLIGSITAEVLLDVLKLTWMGAIYSFMIGVIAYFFNAIFIYWFLTSFICKLYECESISELLKLLFFFLSLDLLLSSSTNS
jgi:hypothetical protein